MNNELVKMVANKIGVSEDKANTAVETVLGYVKDKLPQPIANQVNNVIEGGSSSASGIAGKVGSMFGGEKG